MQSNHFNIKSALLVVGLVLGAALTASAGTYTLNLPAGLSPIANHFDTGGNTFMDVLPNVPVNSGLFKWDRTTCSFVASFFDEFDFAWLPQLLTLKPGDGAFIQLPFAASVTFTGTPHTATLPVNFGCANCGGFALASRQTDGIGTYDNITGVAPTQGAQVQRHIAGQPMLPLGAPNYTVYTFSGGVWSPATPSVDVGESVWILVPCGTVIPMTLNGVTPNQAGNCGSVTVFLNGTGIDPGATIQLSSGGANIPGSGVTVSAYGFGVSATFDLSTAAAGSVWDVVATNPDGTTATLSGAFTAQACLPAQITTQWIGPSQIGVGRQRAFTLAWLNTGNVDAYNAPFIIQGIPLGVTVQILSASPPATLSSSATEQSISFTSLLVPPGQTRYFSIALTAPAVRPMFTLTGSAQAPFASTSTLNVDVLASVDPNDKVGTPGVGAAHYIAGTEILNYQVFFENKPDASAPAQEVFVTDRLDTAKLDVASFSLGPISIGSQTVVPPPGLRAFRTELAWPLDVDANPATVDNILVRIEASLIDNPLDSDYGLITWKFRSIDPMTGLVPVNPLRGFLPPDVTSPEGQGNVLFSVKARQPLATDASIANQAVIVFDLNSPVATPVWVNTIDITPPHSAVLPLAQTQSSPTFTVSWAGADAGSGIASYTIFVSKDNGAYSAFLTGTTAVSAPFTGQTGHSYSFYSVATDRMGYVEPAPTSPDATTDIRIMTPGQRIDDLMTLVQSLGLAHGQETSLLAKLRAALKAVNSGSPALAFNQIKAFRQEVEAQSGKKIPASQADRLITAANQVQ